MAETPQGLLPGHGGDDGSDGEHYYVPGILLNTFHACSLNLTI